MPLQVVTKQSPIHAWDVPIKAGRQVRIHPLNHLLRMENVTRPQIETNRKDKNN